jgi:predicted RNA methylase
MAPVGPPVAGALVAVMLAMQEQLAPFVPTPEDVVQRMLEVADVRPHDVVYDLGCGDGRITIAAVERFAARAVCVELDAALFRQTSARITELGLNRSIEMVHANLLDVDLSPATVVTLYLLEESNVKIRPHLERALRRGTRVVSHDFAIPGWKPASTETMRSEHRIRGRVHRIYLYVAGDALRGDSR